MDDIQQWNILFRAEDAERELLRSLQGVVRKIGAGEPPAEDDQGE
ncbi:hypothetical protein [Streptomyces sp. NBC_01262]|nr:hypothetical protein [Streptomyces sp. NBC_01262]